MQHFTDQQLNDARSRWDIIGADVALKRAGREFQGLCPFHGEKTPSFYVTPDKGFYHCFGCGAHGTVIDYVMRMHGMSFIDAVRHILDLREQRPAARPVRLEPAGSTSQKVEEDMAKILAGCIPIPEQSSAQLYLYLRGLPTKQPGLFFNPSVECWELGVDRSGAPKRLPAIIAPITNSDDEITGILRTWLVDRVEYGGAVDPKDNRAPLRTRKKGMGVMGDGAVRLAEPGELFGLAEGWETACSARALYSIPVWATCGTARFGFPGHWRERRPQKGVAPKLWFPPNEPGADDDAVWLEERPPTIWLPPQVRKLVVFGDNGATGQTVANHAVAYWRQHGIRAFARFPDPQFSDFNDVLLAKLRERNFV